MIKGKKGDEKYYLVISLILGILILAIGLYFIFQEYFTQDEVDWETCRQSVVLRSLNINDDKSFADTIKNQFPFKCKTQVVNINDAKIEDALKKIADTMAGCYYMMGEGKYKLYGKNWVFKDLKCFVCARIEFDNSVKDKYGELSLGEYLQNTKFDKTQTYLQYLAGSSSLPIDSDLSNFKINPRLGDLFVVYSYNKEAWTRQTIGTVLGLGFAIGSIIFTGGASIPVIAIALASGAGTGLFIGNAVSGEDINKQGITITQGTNTDELFTKKCGTIETIPA
jgi:hypothetical protein